MIQNQYEYRTQLSLSMPISYMDKVRDFQERYRLRQKNTAFMQLIDLALFVESKLGLVESIKNEELEELRQQIENGQVVDYVAKMPAQKFRILVDIMRDEEQTRLRAEKKK